MISQCLISFGSNLGRRESVIADAARRISTFAGVGDLRTSRLFQTPPIGGPGGQEPFLNAVAAFDTTLTARKILAILQETEDELGRRRRARWGARSIDLDVVLHGALVGGCQGLIVPHPRYTARLFVLRPACDVAAHYRDPRFGWTLEQLTRHVTAAAPSLALVGDSMEIRRELCRRLADEHGLQTFLQGTISTLAGPIPTASTRTPPRVPSPTSVRGTASASGTTSALGLSPDSSAPRSAAEPNLPSTQQGSEGEPWVSAFVPSLPPLDCPQITAWAVPRLVARLQRTTPKDRWPAPHQMWPGGWQWPEYRLEIDEFDWAVAELASAIESMHCPTDPLTESGDWWR